MDQSFLEECLFVSLLISGILLGAAALVGLVTSILQAATQIQDQTLSIVPKLLTLSLILFALGGWMFEQLEELFHSALQGMISVGTS